MAVADSTERKMRVAESVPTLVLLHCGDEFVEFIHIFFLVATAAQAILFPQMQRLVATLRQIKLGVEHVCNLNLPAAPPLP